MEANEDKLLLFVHWKCQHHLCHTTDCVTCITCKTACITCKTNCITHQKESFLARQTQLLVLLVRQIVWVKISTTPGGPPYATRANNISIFYYIQPSLVLCRKLFLQKFFVQLMSNSLHWQKCYLLYFSCSRFQVELEHCIVPLNFLPSFADHLVD